jgi:hypothetical protein
MYFEHTSIENILILPGLFKNIFIIFDKLFDEIKMVERVVSEMEKIVFLVGFHKLCQFCINLQ